MQRHLTGVDGHVQLAVVLDHLIDRAAVVGVIHMIGGVVEKLLILFSDLLECSVAQSTAVYRNALEAAVGVKVVFVRGVSNDVCAVILRDGGDQRTLVDRNGAGNGEDVVLLHLAVLFRRHSLIDGAEGIVLGVDLEDGGDAGGGIRHSLCADLRADEIEAAIVCNGVAQRDLIAVDRTGHQDLAFTGLDVHFEQDTLRGDRMLGVIVIAVEQAGDAVNHLLVVLHGLLIERVVFVLLVLQQAKGLEHRFRVVFCNAGAAVHCADVDPIFIAQRRECVGLAGITGQALLDLGHHAGDLILRSVGILRLQHAFQLGQFGSRIGSGRISALFIHVLDHAGADLAGGIRVLIVVHETVGLAGRYVRVRDLLQRVAIVAVSILRMNVIADRSRKCGDLERCHQQDQCGEQTENPLFHMYPPKNIERSEVCGSCLPPAEFQNAGGLPC